MNFVPTILAEKDVRLKKNVVFRALSKHKQFGMTFALTIFRN